MKISNANHPIWEVALLIAIFIVFWWRLKVNSSNFDSTEIVTVIESAGFAVGAMGLLLAARRFLRSKS